MKQRRPPLLSRWRRVGAGSFLVVLLVAAVAVGQGLPPASGNAAFAHVVALSQQVGPRPAGTVADQRAAGYIADQLRRLGYGVEQQRFPFQFFGETRSPVLTVLSPSQVSFRPVTLFYSAATPTSGIEADLVAAGFGRAEEFQGRPVQGRIVVVERGEIFFRDKVRNAAAAGAVAVLVYNNQPGPAQAGTLIEPSSIPAVMIAQDEGRQLLEWLAVGPVRLRLVVSTVVEERTSQNVIGIKRGVRAPSEIVVLGGHMDSVPDAPGANDNASGTAAMLEAARLLATARTARTVHFVAFGAEELGLIGSRFYVAQLRTPEGEARGSVTAMVNMDMVGRGPGLLIGGSGGTPPMLEVAERAAARLGIRVTRFRLTRGGSDHAPFEQAGIPVLFMHTGDDDVMHTPGDVAERLDAALLAHAATLAASIVLELAQPVRSSSTGQLAVAARGNSVRWGSLLIPVARR